MTLQRPQGHTTEDDRLIDRKQQPARRGGAASRQGIEFFGETLKAQIDAGVRLILEKERADIVAIGGEGRVTDRSHRVSFGVSRESCACPGPRIEMV
jgi:hypothetical protein